MSSQSLDRYGFMDDRKPILERLDSFIAEVERLGYDAGAIFQGALNEHLLSLAFGVPPQIIRMYYGLCLCDGEERKLLAERRMDTGLLRTLMLIEPKIRKELYKLIDELLDHEFPVSAIIDFVDSGAWMTRIRDVFDAVSRNYWAAVSGYLKDTNTVSGTINRQFRKLLMDIKIFGASDKQLQWLERGIIHDYVQGLGIFTSAALRKNYGEAVEWIERYLRDYEKYMLSEGQ